MYSRQWLPGVFFPWKHTENSASMTLDRHRETRVFCSWQRKFSELLLTKQISSHDYKMALKLQVLSESLLARQW